MAEATRSQMILREVEEMMNGKLRSIEDKVGAMNESMDRRAGAIEDKVGEMGTMLDTKIAEMFTAIKVFTDRANRPSSSNSEEMRNGAGSQDLESQRQAMAARYQGSNRNRQGNPLNPNSTYSGLTRLSRIDFPKFDGEMVKEWVYKCEKFFAIDKTPGEIKVNLASMHLEGQAAKWHHACFHRDDDVEVVTDWGEYRELLMERFGQILDDPIADLKNLQELDGVVAYHNKFEEIRTRVKMSEAYLVSAYLAGLKNDTQMHVRMFQPQTIRHCFTLAKLYESAHPKGSGFVKNGNSSYGVGKPFFKNGNNASLLPTPKPNLVLPKTNSFSKYGEEGNDNGNSNRRLLSAEEMSERRSKGLCYFCDEKYSPGHYLKHKKNQLFLLEAGEEEEVDIHEEDDSIENDEQSIQASVSAVSGVEGFQTMRVRGTHDKRSLFILIDIGSTQNFISKEVAELVLMYSGMLVSVVLLLPIFVCISLNSGLQMFCLGFHKFWPCLANIVTLRFSLILGLINNGPDRYCIAPCSSGLWWIILLRAYGKCSGDLTVPERIDVCLADGLLDRSYYL